MSRAGYRIGARKKPKRGLGAVLIEWKSVKAALEPRPDEVMTMVQAGKFLKVHFFQLRKLLDEGFLEATEYKEKDRKATRARFLTRDSCVRFARRPMGEFIDPSTWRQAS